MSRLKPYIKTARPLHWVKNLIICLPVFYAGQIWNMGHWDVLALGFIAFCLISSAVYYFNDIFDRDVDWFNPNVNRPIANMEISVIAASITSGILTLCSMIVGIILGWQALVILIGYAILNIGYTLYFKYKDVIGSMFIASGFTLRFILGAVIIGLPINAWGALFVFTCTGFMHIFKAMYKYAGYRRQALQWARIILGYSTPIFYILWMLSLNVTTLGLILLLISAIFVYISLVLYNLSVSLTGVFSPLSVIITSIELLTVMLIIGGLATLGVYIA